MKDFINEIIDNLQNSNENNDNDDVDTEDMIESIKDTKESEGFEGYEESQEPKGTKSIRQYWVEILLCLTCLCYLYYISSSIYNYTFLGFSLGRVVSQVLVFILPFIGLWLFYRVNKTRKVESTKQNNSSKNLLIALKQNGRCASCTNILDKDYLLEPVTKGDKKNLRAVCHTCYDRSCLNNSLYKTLRDF